MEKESNIIRKQIEYQLKNNTFIRVGEMFNERFETITNSELVELYLKFRTHIETNKTTTIELSRNQLAIIYIISFLSKN